MLTAGFPGSGSKVSAFATTDFGGTRKPGLTPRERPDWTLRIKSCIYVGCDDLTGKIASNTKDSPPFSVGISENSTLSSIVLASGRSKLCPSSRSIRARFACASAIENWNAPGEKVSFLVFSRSDTVASAL